MDCVIVGAPYNVLSATATEYNVLSGGVWWSSTAANHQQLVSEAGTFKNLYIKLRTAVAIGKNSFTFKIYKNETPTTITCAVGGGGTQASDTTHTFTVVAGDRVCIQCVPAGSPGTAVYPKWSIMFTSTTAANSTLLGGNEDIPPTAASATEYNQLQTSYYWNATESELAQIIPVNGTISKLYVRNTAYPGTGNERTFTVMVNGSPTDMQVVFSGSGLGAVADSDTTHSVDLVKGDLVSIRCENNSNGIHSVTRAAWAVTWTPDTPGEYLCMGGTPDDPSAAGNEVNCIGAYWIWFSTTIEDYTSSVGQVPAVMQDFAYRVTTAPGVGKSYDLTVRAGLSDTTITTPITGTETKAYDNDHTYDLVNYERLSLWCDPTDTPALSVATSWSVVFYIEVPVVEGDDECESTGDIAFLTIDVGSDGEMYIDSDIITGVEIRLKRVCP